MATIIYPDGRHYRDAGLLRVSVVQVGLVALKLGGVIGWPWMIVLAPAVIGIGVLALFVLAAMIVALVVG